MADMKKNRGLGRGLSALMADVGPEPTSTAAAPARPDLIVPVEKVFPNPDQPRRSFTDEHLQDLAASIKAKGIIQPLIVRKRASGDGEYEIVAGERRWRAAQMAQLHEIPVLVRDFTDTEVEKLGEELGKSRSHIANLMRLLQLPSDVQDLLVAGELSAGHARALITSDDPSLSVRATEALAKKKDGESGSAPTRRKSGGGEKDADTKALESDLSAATGLSVSVDHKAGGETGQVTIKYASLDQLDEICRILSAS